MAVKHLLIGLPEAGKSTFMAALWHVLEGGRIAGSLTLAEVHGDQEYLNEIRDAWASCKPLERNRRGQGKLVAMMVEAKKEAEVIELVLPDPAGESFSDQWEVSRCPREYVDLAREAAGILLFVNPDRVDQGLSINQVVEAADAAGARAEHEGSRSAAQGWVPAFAGTQVQLVELLQVLMRPPFEHKGLPVAVIVSAWDRLDDLGQTPEQWLAEALPLLRQYLHANGGSFPYRVYGVSAQGGDLARDRERLLAEVDPWKRVVVVGPDSARNDISAPLRWLLVAGKMMD